MKKIMIMAVPASLLSASVLLTVNSAFGSEVDDLKQLLALEKEENEKRLSRLEQRLLQQSSTGPIAKNSSTSFNPQISVILDGRFNAYSEPLDYHLPGFTVAGEAGLAPEGFSLGHSEMTLSSPIDDKFFGQFTMAFHEHDGHAEVEVEEAFVETLALGNGFTIRAGRFFSSIGYQNLQHEHAWDFSDAALVYAGLWGNKYIDDGVRLSWIAPTDMFLELGYEAFAGNGYPNGDKSSGIGSQVLFVNTGGDIGRSHSWLLGLSYMATDVEGRESLASGHDEHEKHEEHEHEEDAFSPQFSGDSDSFNVSFVYKWAPNGNPKYQNFKLQGEYFLRKEKGLLIAELEHMGEAHIETGALTSQLKGGYVQAIYQFMPQWRVGARYDYLTSEHDGEEEFVDAAGLDSHGYSPTRNSAVLDWLPSEFSRLRLQYSQDKSYDVTQDIISVGYTMSFGSHGAHSF